MCHKTDYEQCISESYQTSFQQALLIIVLLFFNLCEDLLLVCSWCDYLGWGGPMGKCGALSGQRWHLCPVLGLRIHQVAFVLRGVLLPGGPLPPRCRPPGHSAPEQSSLSCG
jgi:hypothetical protein